jgi:hypothetical protein
MSPIRILLAPLSITALSGCVVAPAPYPYSYGYAPGYYGYGPGYVAAPAVVVRGGWGTVLPGSTVWPDNTPCRRAFKREVG